MGVYKSLAPTIGGGESLFSLTVGVVLLAVELVLLTFR